MLNNHEGDISIGGHSGEEFLEGFESSGRGAYSDNEECPVFFIFSGGFPFFAFWGHAGVSIFNQKNPMVIVFELIFILQGLTLAP
jgi:hypothetical protein